MKKKNKKNQIRMRMRLSKILLCILAILLCAAPRAYGQYFNLYYDEAGEYDVTVDEINKARGEAGLEKNGVLYWLDVGSGTIVNLYASVENCVYVYPGGILNIYSGSVGWFVILTTTTGEQDPIVTVYGTNFEVDWECNGTFVSLDGADEFTPLPEYGSILKGFYENGDPIELRFLSDDIPIKLKETDSKVVEIDIKPGGNPNNINPRSKGVVPVAILSSETFNASNVDPESVTFAGAEPERWKLCDVDDDGDDDLLFHFKTQDLLKSENNPDGLEEDSKTATLTGKTFEDSGGEDIELTDTVRIIQSKEK